MTEVDARSAAITASQLLSEVSGKQVIGVTSVQRTDEGWTVQLELIELNRVPSTQDVIGSYAVDIDNAGALLGFKQIDRYQRGNANGGPA